MAAIDEDPGTTVLTFLLGLVVGAVIIGVCWWALGNRTDGVGSAVTDPTRGPDAPASRLLTRPVRETPARVRLDRCEEVFESQTAPMAAIGPALSQWQVHIGAMNKLVTGAITLRQANQFWNSTRHNAFRNLRTFAVAHRRYDRRTARCPDPAGLAKPSARLRECTRAVRARSRTLGAATVALHTWRMHARDMEMLRRGEMTAAEASRMWLRSWHRGNRQVRVYQADARASRSIGSDDPCAR